MPVHRPVRPVRRAVSPLLLALAAGAVWPLAAGAQTCPDGRPFEIREAGPQVTQEVTLAGGAKYLGRVIETGDTVRFELLSGDVLALARPRIVCLRPIVGTRREGEFWREDPNETRLFFGPTGRALGRGEGYFSVVEILMPFVSMGVTDRLTFSGGMPLFFGSGGIDVFWLAPKLQVVRTDRFHGSIGVLSFFAAGESESVGVLYGVGTIGASSDRAFTAGIGWGYTSEGGLYEAPALMAGFESRIGRATKIISENYLFPDEGFGLLSLGPRFFGERLSADLGLAMPIGVDEFIIFPLVNFAWNW